MNCEYNSKSPALQQAAQKCDDFLIHIRVYTIQSAAEDSYSSVSDWVVCMHEIMWIN